MTDFELSALQDLRSDVPLPDDATAARIYARATSASRRPAARRRLVVAVCAVALLVAAGAVAAVKEGPWWQDAPPAVDPQAVASVANDNMPAKVDVSRARTVATDGDAALVAVPIDETGYCLIATLDGRARFGSPCVYQLDDILRSVSRGTSSPGGGRWLAYGRIADPRAAKLDLGAFDVELQRGGFFVVEIPKDDWRKLDGTANAGAVLDASGSVVRRGCVNWGAAPGERDSTSETMLWLDPAATCRPQVTPVQPTLDLTHATKVADVTLTEPYSVWKAGETITFLRAEQWDGSTCIVATGPRLPAAVQNGAPGCPGTSLRPGGPALDPSLGATLEHDGAKAFYTWTIEGATRADAKIARLALTSPGTTVHVDYAGGFFFAQLPVTTPGPLKGTIPFPGGPWILTGYDAAGHEVARSDLNELHRRASPH